MIVWILFVLKIDLIMCKCIWCVFEKKEDLLVLKIVLMIWK